MTDDHITLDAVSERRLQLRALGYCPLPLYGKEPPQYGKNNTRGGLAGWSSLTDVTPQMISMWARTWPDARNTGCLTRLMPTLDVDVMHEPAVVEVEDFIREKFEERGFFLTRIGRPPRRAIPFRCNAPFKKITALLQAPNGSPGEKIELLCDGQQVVVDGIHPDIDKPYTWFGGAPWDIAHVDLPYLHEDEAQQLVTSVVHILLEHGYRRATPEHAITRSNGSPAQHDNPGGELGWNILITNILTGCNLHDSIRDLPCMLAASGMNPGSAMHLMQALIEQIEPYDLRVEARLRDLPRAIDGAYKKFGKR